MKTLELQQKIIEEFCEFLHRRENAEKNQTQHLIDLLNKIPAQGRESQCMKGFYEELSNIYGRNLSNSEKIEPPPEEKSFMSHIIYTYMGDYKGYRDVFCGNMKENPVTEEIRRRMEAACSNVNKEFWSKYAVPLITEAITAVVSEVSVNGNKLAEDLNKNHQILRQAVASGYCIHYQKGYEAVKNILQEIEEGGMAENCRYLLSKALPEDEALRANLNKLFSAGGADTAAAEWILFHFCVTLQALGHENIAEVLEACSRAGMAVPEVLKGENWRNGTYCDWFAPIHGSDMANQLREIRGDMPVRQWVRIGVHDNNYKLGYARSFCQWGKMAWYV